VLIALLVPAVQKVKDAALQASQFGSLLRFATAALVTVCGNECFPENPVTLTERSDIPIQKTIDVASKLFADIGTNPPTADQVALILNSLLPAVQRGEAELQNELFSLQNPANLHNPGELEAYLELKHSLVDLITELHQLDERLQQLLRMVAA
jgi:hypothetical protein